MTYEQFWYGDPRLFDVYQKAYLRDKSYTAWLQGQHDAVAYSVALENAFAKKGATPVEYPKWKDPVPDRPIWSVEQNNIEKKFREAQANQNLWLHNMINK